MTQGKQSAIGQPQPQLETQGFPVWGQDQQRADCQPRARDSAVAHLSTPLQAV